MRKLPSFLSNAALAALLIAPTGARRVAAFPSQGTIERTTELSAPAHRAPETPRLQHLLEQGQGNARNDRPQDGFLPDRYSALATRFSPLALPLLCLPSTVGSTLLGAPLLPTGPPAFVS